MIENTENNDIHSDYGQKALDALLDILKDVESTGAARVAAARALLDRYQPKANAETNKREADERAEALAEARCLIAELVHIQSAGAHQPAALDEVGASEPATTAAEPVTAS